MHRRYRILSSFAAGVTLLAAAGLLGGCAGGASKEPPTSSGYYNGPMEKHGNPAGGSAVGNAPKADG